MKVDLFHRGPCWTPHKPEECTRCAESASGLCFDPRLFLSDGAVVLRVDVLSGKAKEEVKQKYEPFMFSSKPKPVKTHRTISLVEAS